MPNDALTADFKQHIIDMGHGIPLVGIASIDRFERAPDGHHPRDFISTSEAVAVIALPIASGLMSWHEYMEDSEAVTEIETYVDANGTEKTWSPRTIIRKHVERRCAYEVMNMELQNYSMYGALFLEKAGYRSTYLPTTYGQTLSWPGNYEPNFPVPPKGFAPFSHKHAAVAAGLGRFGLNNLLLTPQFGPRQRLVSIITAAPLTPDPIIEKPLCRGAVECAKCLERCPAGACGEPRQVDLGFVTEEIGHFRIDKCRGYYKVSALGAQCARECMTECPLASHVGEAGTAAS